ncbi:MAG: DUF2867 domain-containing protein [Hyphomicrobiaceae bacterium]|nr:DUF2867 domain-containing protein [Hyphomicrobiaceae bacterium]
MDRPSLNEAPSASRWTSVDFPSHSEIHADFVSRASLVESYRFELPVADMTVTDIFLGIFGGKPGWMKAAIILRNIAVKPFGIETPLVADVLSNARRTTYRVGETIWAWPIFTLTGDELVAGRDNKHLDFRVSVLKSVENGGQFATVSTVCVTHNRAGEIYLKTILPIHKHGIRFLISRALSGYVHPTIPR